MSRRLLVALAALAVALALVAAAAPAALAKVGSYPLQAGHVTRFELRGTNGYRFAVSINDRGYVSVTARRGGSHAVYVAPGRTDGLGGAATFPGLGRVDFSFRPSGRERALPPYSECDGTRSVQAGVARGVFRFRGERGYSRARATRARAELQSWTAQRCRYLEFGRGSDRQNGVVADLLAFRIAKPYPELTATRYSARARPLRRRIEFSASVASRERGVFIFRHVSASAPPPSLRVLEPKRAPENLLVRPPAPFHGEATLSRTPESTFAWDGSLRVAFPGTGEIPLTGPDFILNYCALRGCLDQFPERPPFRRAR